MPDWAGIDNDPAIPPEWKAAAKKRAGEMAGVPTPTATPTPLGGAIAPVATPTPGGIATPIPPGFVQRYEQNLQDINESIDEKVLRPALGTTGAAAWPIKPPSSIPEQVTWLTALTAPYLFPGSLALRLMSPTVLSPLSSELTGSRVKPGEALAVGGLTALAGESGRAYSYLKRGAVESPQVLEQRSIDLQNVTETLHNTMPDVVPGGLNTPTQVNDYFTQNTPNDIWGQELRQSQAMENTSRAIAEQGERDNRDALARAETSFNAENARNQTKLDKDMAAVSRMPAGARNYRQAVAQRRFDWEQARIQHDFENAQRAAQQALDASKRNSGQLQRQADTIRKGFEDKAAKFDWISNRLFNDKNFAPGYKKVALNARNIQGTLMDPGAIHAGLQAGIPRQAIKDIRFKLFGATNETLPEDVMGEIDTEGAGFHPGFRMFQHTGDIPSGGLHMNIPYPVEFAGARQLTLNPNEMWSNLLKIMIARIGYGIGDLQEEQTTSENTHMPIGAEGDTK